MDIFLWLAETRIISEVQVFLSFRRLKMKLVKCIIVLLLLLLQAHKQANGNQIGIPKRTRNISQGKQKEEKPRTPWTAGTPRTPGH